VECIGRGKARSPYEFGCKVSIATPVTAPKGGQFVLHAKVLHGNPYEARRDWWYEARPSDVRIVDKCPASSQYRWSRRLVPPETACSFVVTPVPPVPPGKQNVARKNEIAEVRPTAMPTTPPGP
jgi:hypothetical protein